MRPRWLLLSVGVLSGEDWFEPSTVHLHRVERIWLSYAVRCADAVAFARPMGTPRAPLECRGPNAWREGGSMLPLVLSQETVARERTTSESISKTTWAANSAVI
jgi:hypothetical protein